jgi:hypothetical protein
LTHIWPARPYIRLMIRLASGHVVSLEPTRESQLLFLWGLLAIFLSLNDETSTSHLSIYRLLLLLLNSADLLNSQRVLMSTSIIRQGWLLKRGPS